MGFMANAFAGIVLAGGESRRFGSPKAFAKREGVSFYQYSIDILTPFTSSIVLVTRPELQHMFYREEDVGVKVINDQDIYRGQGPLAGIYSAMDEVFADWYFVLPTDVPFIEKWVLEQLVQYTDSAVQAIVPIVCGKEQPLIAIYHKSVKNMIADQLSKGKRSLRNILEQIDVKYEKINNEKPFRNINRPEDIFN
jgi:molybdenum cofactor guanylyltransferase